MDIQTANSKNIYDTNVYALEEYVIPLEDGGLLYFKDVDTTLLMEGTLCISESCIILSIVNQVNALVKK